MTCNCNRTGDIEYTIVLNQQGPQGRQGNRGQDGFSPIVDVYSNTEANYQLKIISAEGEIITPNLKGQDASLNNVAIVNETNLFSEVNRFQQNVFFNGALYVEGDGGYINFVGSSNEVRLRGSVPLVATTSIDIRDVPFKLSNGGYTTTFAKIERQLFIGGASDNNDKVFVYGTLYARREGTENVTDKVILEPEFDELANDVVAINSALGGTSFKKYTEAEYASITNPDANTLYMVTNPDGNTFKLYLGSIELEGGGGGTVLSGDNASQKTYIENVDASVSATKVE